MGIDIPQAARDLIAALERQPWGQVSPSIYETGRLVTLAPWLTGHADRIGFLLDSQRTDGGWGGPGGYSLVPTLSATEALLSTLGDKAAGQRGSQPTNLVDAADRGLRALVEWAHSTGPSVPDTPAVDLIVPALVARISQHLDELDDSPLRGLGGWSVGSRLGLPVGMTSARLDAIRGLLSAGSPVPEKLFHALEVVGDRARGLTGVRPSWSGSIGASPAATAAWLGSRAGDASAVTYLETAVGRHGGPVPCTTPITSFERAWVVSGLARAGIPLPALPRLAESLAAVLGPQGTPGGPGLPADADTTSVVLYALGQLGRPVEPDSLWRYDTGSYFCTWPGEDGYSITTNAHVLDAFGQYVATAIDDVPPRYPAAVRRLSDWLCEHQHPAGHWEDRWHASPYYATACAALALSEFGRRPAATEAVESAVDWVVASQRTDGGWGRWAGTVEETAYALQVLHATGTARPGIDMAARRGYAYLRDNRGQQDGPALWHDKDLYRPTAIVEAATLAALHLLQARVGAHRAAVIPHQRSSHPITNSMITNLE